MQMSGKAERASFSAFPGFDCSSVKQILFVFFFFFIIIFSRPGHLTLSLSIVPHFSSILATANQPQNLEPSTKWQLLLGNANTRLYLAAIAISQGCWNWVLVSQGLQDRCYPKSQRAQTGLSLKLCFSVSNGTKEASQHLLVNWHLNGNCQWNISIWLLSYDSRAGSGAAGSEGGLLSECSFCTCVLGPALYSKV